VTRTNADRILATEVTRLPETVKNRLLTHPFVSLSLDYAHKRPARPVMRRMPDLSDRPDLFPKLVVKSWRDSGSLRIISSHENLENAILRRLGTLSATQQKMLDILSLTETSCRLHLFPARDFQHISEIRIRPLPSGSVQITSECARGKSSLLLSEKRDALKSCAIDTANAFDFPVIVDLGIKPDGAIFVVDINPVLERTR